MKRRWFQIHLSTAVVLMFVAGGILWLNVRGTKKYVYYEFLESAESLHSNSVLIGKTIGWPRSILTVESIERHPISVKDIPPESTFYDRPPSESGISAASLIVNLVIALFFLVVFAYCSESLIRRREARKP